MKYFCVYVKFEMVKKIVGNIECAPSYRMNQENIHDKTMILQTVTTWTKKDKT